MEPDLNAISVGDEAPSFVRTTGVANWNRYAAVNDEFIDIHMDPAAARAVGMPDVFGMGNLRIAYLHNLLHDWLGDAGDIVELRCEFRGLNLPGDELTCTATVTGTERRDGLPLAHLDLAVTNQRGENTTPGTATVVVFETGAIVPPAPPPLEPSGDATPGTFLEQSTIDRLGETLDPVPSLPVGANDIRRWAMATYWPQRVPPEYYDEEVAAAGPWGGLVAPRDFDPFAWMLDRPWSGTWLRGMGTEPGTRVLNGGQRNLYFQPIRPGDVISVVRRFADVVERETKRGPMVFYLSEFRWENQRGELVRLGYQTTIYY